SGFDSGWLSGRPSSAARLCQRSPSGLLMSSVMDRVVPLRDGFATSTLGRPGPSHRIHLMLARPERRSPQPEAAARDARRALPPRVGVPQTVSRRGDEVHPLRLAGTDLDLSRPAQLLAGHVAPAGANLERVG